MKDPVFSGRDLADAVQVASRSLGLPAETLRYVVLERGSTGHLGVGGTPAMIAVLLEAAGGAEGVARGGRVAVRPEEPRRPRALLSSLVRDLGRAAGLELTAELEETDEGLLLRLDGADRDFFLEEDGEVLKALEHVLQRVAQGENEPRRLIVECRGHRTRRDDALRRGALQLAEQVLADGQPRRTEPLNSYERRVVHVTLGDVAGVRTFSVGEGADRRVTVAPAEAAAPGDAGTPAEPA
ncbi:MAG TPA: R3H domain-containing nucleic acid-binding protein [Vicinamibacteria bacterium]|nr:R3H domain-containing nucleic acid-binding protein [Vicinamibacteria bacterium]